MSGRSMGMSGVAAGDSPRAASAGAMLLSRHGFAAVVSRGPRRGLAFDCRSEAAIEAPQADPGATP
jgi:hypothetical protein